MLRATAIALGLCLLSACGAGIDEARQSLTASLAIPKEVEFREMKSYPGDAVCGEYSAYSSHIAPKDDFKPFIVVRGTLYREPLPIQLDIYCSDDPAAALLKQTGVGPYDADNEALARISADYAALTAALERYYVDSHYYPTADQTLEALVRPMPRRDRPLPKFPADGYLPAIPKDPWGRDYIYSDEQWGRVKGRYEILTLGADGAVGGGGVNADVSSNIFPYLDHVAHSLGQR